MLHIGITYHVNLTLGQVNILLSMLIIIFNAAVIKVKVGAGTLLNMILVGSYIDMLRTLDIIPMQSSPLWGYLQIFLAMVVMSFGLYFYISAGLGAGPRDSLFIGISKSLNKPPGLIKSVIEITAAAAGVMLSAPIGIGTAIFAFLSGYIMQFVFKILNFNVKEVNHQFLEETFNIFHKKKQ